MTSDNPASGGEKCGAPDCGHVRRWHDHGRCSGDLMSCFCRLFRASSSVAVPPATHPDEAVAPVGEDSPHLSAYGECLCDCSRCTRDPGCICPDCVATDHDHNSRPVAVPPAEVPDECPWPVGTVLRSNGESGVFTWVFEHAVEGRWYEVGKGERQDWAYVASFPNLVELVPAGTPVVPEAPAASVDDDALAGEYPYESDEYPADAVEESAAPAEIVEAAERVYVRKGGGTQGFRFAVDYIWTAALSHVREETAALPIEEPPVGSIVVDETDGVAFQRMEFGSQTWWKRVTINSSALPWTWDELRERGVRLLWTSEGVEHVG